MSDKSKQITFEYDTIEAWVKLNAPDEYISTILIALRNQCANDIQKAFYSNQFPRAGMPYSEEDLEHINDLFPQWIEHNNDYNFERGWEARKPIESKLVKLLGREFKSIKAKARTMGLLK